MCSNDESDAWKIGPIRLKKEASFTSASAFLLSLVAVFSTATSLIVGSRLSLIVDDEATFFAQRCYNKGSNEITVEPMIAFSVFAKGPGSNSIIVTGVDLRLFDTRFRNSKFTYKAQYLVEIQSSTFNVEAGHHDTEANCKGRASDSEFRKNGMTVTSTGDFVPIIVEPGKSIMVQSTAFRPAYDPEEKIKHPRMSWDEFIQSSNALSDNQLNIAIRPEMRNLGLIPWVKQQFFPYEVSCRVVMNDATLSIAKEREYVTPPMICG